jgi:hypothetical protein
VTVGVAVALAVALGVVPGCVGAGVGVGPPPFTDQTHCVGFGPGVEQVSCQNRPFGSGPAFAAWTMTFHVFEYTHVPGAKPKASLPPGKTIGCPEHEPVRSPEWHCPFSLLITSVEEVASYPIEVTPLQSSVVQIFEAGITCGIAHFPRTSTKPARSWTVSR